MSRPDPTLREFIPRRLRVRHLAAGLDLPPRAVRHLLDRGDIPAHQLEPVRARYVTPEELAQFAARTGEPLDWHAIAEEELDLDAD